MSRLPALARRGIALDVGVATLAGVFAVALTWGTVAGLLGLGGTTFAGEKAAVDAAALYAGQPLYGDPGSAYASSVYTPLLPVLGAVADHLWFWRGWVPLLTFLASLVMVGVVARAVYDRSRRDPLAAVEAIGIGALSYWLVGALSPGYFWNDRPDQLAWTLAISGLLLTPRAARSNVAAVGCVLLLSAAFWAKQPSAVAAGAAFVWLAIAAWRHRARRLRAVSLAAAFVLLNGVTVAAVDWLTHGWFVRIAFEWPAQQPCCEISSSWGAYLKGFVTEFSVRFLFGALVFVAIAVAVTVAAGRRAPMPRRDEVWQLLPVAIFTPLALVAAILTRHKIGAAPNHDLGLAWGLVLLTAGGYRYLRRTAAGSAFVAVLLALLLVGSQVVSSRQLRGYDLTVPSLRPIPRWNTAPDDLAAYARTHVVFHPDYGDLSVGAADEAFPTLVNLTGFLYVGRTPDYLARLIVERRFDLVFPYASTATYQGVVEKDYKWKVNRAIDLEYRPSASVPKGGKVPVAGADPAPWLTRCWGPYSVNGISLRQHLGGGFWCPEGTVLTLRETPAAFADVHTATASISGAVRLTLRPGSSYSVSLVRNGRTLWQAAGRAAHSQVSSGGAPGQRWISISLPATDHAQLSLGASRGSAAQFDLAAVTATTG